MAIALVNINTNTGNSAAPSVTLPSGSVGHVLIVYLQIYNWNSGAWETIDSNSTFPADRDFELTKFIPDLTDYKDPQKVITCRVYQLAI